MNLDLEYLKKITKLINDNSLSEVSLQEGDKSITIKKSCEKNTVVKAETLCESQNQIDDTVKENSRAKNAITSPMVGSFYASPTPSGKPFVKIGDTVSAGQVVCIIEAMKLMNEIESDISGRVTEICVEDGQSVEYGQVLMYVE